jgi:uncharacterized protein with PIN domain
VKTAVDNMNAEVSSRLDASLNHLAKLILLGGYEVKALYHLSQQEDTVICELKKIDRATCNTSTEAHYQTALQRQIEKETASLVEMEKTVHPDAALVLARMNDAREKMEKCCPPPAEKPLCEFEPCSAPSPLEPPRFDVPVK